MKKKQDKRGRTRRLFLRILAVIAVFFALVYAGARIMMYSGRNRLRDNANSKGPDMVMDDPEPVQDSSYVWQEGWVRYNGDVYAYNEDIMTFLVMGIDKMGEAEANRDLTSGGQSDAIFLLIIDPHEETISIFAVDRNTMTDIIMVGVGDGGTDVVTTAQLTVQHAFGDGGAKSCEMTRDRVSELFFDLPVHGYISVNYEAIPYINDAVGGIEVVIPEDVAGARKDWHTGDTVLLKGNDAITFVKWRDITVYESARLRTRRQKTYLTSFVAKAIAATKQDITMPITLYNKVKGYTVTDITVDEMAYLASELTGYRFSGDQIYTMEGETVMGEMYEEFYPDMDALKEQMIEIFYEKVDLDEE
ncbi:MAG: LCP family protein [Eubacterium sp.]|nr:LCP family protein [Eubacterium sp.]MCM1303065.1 LCP family protein [Butyrivibrio sp.]MCM1343386.1 LCP family protein [Muribaculaceae bacterium]MCM1410555.1 LCP family protein [Lachnospiraceae bacterium]